VAHPSAWQSTRHAEVATTIKKRLLAPRTFPQLTTFSVYARPLL
jgi:hypothetical protein